MLSSPLHLPVSLQVRRKKDDQFCRYSPNSKYLLSSCQGILAVFGSSSAISSSVQNVWNIPPFLYCSPETTTTSTPGLLSCCPLFSHLCYTDIDVIFHTSQNVFQIWSTLVGYGELALGFEPMRNRELYLEWWVKLWDSK